MSDVEIGVVGAGGAGGADGVANVVDVRDVMCALWGMMHEDGTNDETGNFKQFDDWIVYTRMSLAPGNFISGEFCVAELVRMREKEDEYYKFEPEERMDWFVRSSGFQVRNFKGSVIPGSRLEKISVEGVKNRKEESDLTLDFKIITEPEKTIEFKVMRSSVKMDFATFVRWTKVRDRFDDGGGDRNVKRMRVADADALEEGEKEEVVVPDVQSNGFIFMPDDWVLTECHRLSDLVKAGTAQRDHFTYEDGVVDGFRRLWHQTQVYPKHGQRDTHMNLAQQLFEYFYQTHIVLCDRGAFSDHMLIMKTGPVRAHQKLERPDNQDTLWNAVFCAMYDHKLFQFKMSIQPMQQADAPVRVIVPTTVADIKKFIDSLPLHRFRFGGLHVGAAELLNEFNTWTTAQGNGTITSTQLSNFLAMIGIHHAPRTKKGRFYNIPRPEQQ